MSKILIASFLFLLSGCSMNGQIDYMGPDPYLSYSPKVASVSGAKVEETAQKYSVTHSIGHVTTSSVQEKNGYVIYLGSQSSAASDVLVTPE